MQILKGRKKASSG